jgi:hypothetical protein
LWNQKSTVGWHNNGMVSITLDLGQTYPVGGLDFTSVGGGNDVGVPAMIHLWTSEDGKSFRFGGELIAAAWRKGLPVAKNGSDAYRGRPVGDAGNAGFTYYAENLKLAGRYLKLTVLPGGQYLFCDEIRVWKGDFALNAVTPSAIVLTDKFDAWTLQNKWTEIARIRMLYDLQELQRSPRGETVAAEINGLRQEVLAMARLNRLDLSKGLPYTGLHARIWALNGKLQRAAGSQPFVLWPTSRYAPLHPFDAPATASASAAVTVDMIGNEYRSAAVNLSNFSDRPVTATIKLRWRDKPSSVAWSPDKLILRQVRFTESQMRFISDKPLPAAAAVGENSWRVEIPAGVTGQLWLTFHSTAVPRGEYAALLTADLPGEKTPLTLPISIHVHAGALPTRPTLETYLWDSLDLPKGTGAVTPQNQRAAVKTMRDYLIGSNFINRWDLPGIEKRADGSFGIPPEQFKPFDAWLTAVAPARRYYLYIEANAEGDPLYTGGYPRGTPEYARAIRAYFTDLAHHLKARHFDPHQFVIEVLDEPSGQPIDLAAAEFIRIAKSAVPEFKFFENPMTRITPELLAASDIVCPKIYNLEQDPALSAYYQTLRGHATKELHGYNCHQNSLILPANSYYRGTLWQAWRYGMTGAGMWVYMYYGQPDTWDNFNVGTYDGVVFVTPDSVTPGKNLEAWREGIEDYEYFYILQTLLAAGETKKLPAAMLSRARQLTETAAERTWTAVQKSRPRDWPVNDPFDQTRLELLAEIDAWSDALQGKFQ